jgi:hypothetical protein
MALHHDAIINKLDVLSVPPKLEVKNSEGSSKFELFGTEITINSDEDWGPSNSVLETKLENSKIEIQMQSGLKIRIS